jgi:type III pantothenate kinase
MIFNLSKTNNKKNQFVHSHFQPPFMLLAIDIGNTRIKAAVFECNTVLKNFIFEKAKLQDQVSAIIAEFKTITDIVISSVADFPEGLSFPPVRLNMVTHQWKFPFSNLYDTPETLGVDRMILAAGAVLQFPAQNRLVIDAGTCITYDFVNDADQFLGGAISPGISLRYRALHNYTAKLPLLTAEKPPGYTGTSTASSIHSGVVNGIVFEIEGFIAEYQRNYPNFIIILTGGDAEFLAERFKNTIFANSNFLLESLNQTFQYKTRND